MEVAVITKMLRNLTDVFPEMLSTFIFQMKYQRWYVIVLLNTCKHWSLGSGHTEHRYEGIGHGNERHDNQRYKL